MQSLTFNRSVVYFIIKQSSIASVVFYTYKTLQVLTVVQTKMKTKSYIGCDSASGYKAFIELALWSK